MSEAAFGRARELASWKERVRAGFEGVHIDHIDLDVSVADIGVDRGAEAVVALGSLTPDDVEVQLLHGPVGQGRSEEQTSELQSLMRISYAVFCLKKKTELNRFKL